MYHYGNKRSVLMDNFKAVYKILSQLEKEMDNEYADIGKFDANWLKYEMEKYMTLMKSKMIPDTME